MTCRMGVSIKPMRRDRAVYHDVVACAGNSFRIVSPTRRLSTVVGIARSSEKPTWMRANVLPRTRRKSRTAPPTNTGRRITTCELRNQNPSSNARAPGARRRCVAGSRGASPRSQCVGRGSAAARKCGRNRTAGGEHDDSDAIP